ncbi:DUF6318 family protein [Demequina pelophila]|uniref:DUF6318 family protein n=1 Tax=Demequina pelophila TaxID=1638984 RepID=UPI0007841891|nr:DUF6318 family protein [Demequina pelophila]
MRFVLGGAAIAVSVGVLSGCTGAPGPIVSETPVPTAAGSVSGPASPEPAVSEAGAYPTPSPSAAASPSPSADVQPSVSAAAPLSNEELFALMPEGADSPDLDGAVITAVFFLEQHAPMYKTGDTSLWDSLSTDACQYCVDASSSLNETDTSGLSYRGGGVVASEMDARGVLAPDNETLATVVVEMPVLEAAWVDASNDVVQQFPAAEMTFALELARVHGAWRVQQFAAEARQ